MCADETNTQLPESLGVLIGLARTELVRAIEHDLVEQGVDMRFSQVIALKHLHRRGPMSASELARSFGHDGGAMTRLLDQLEELGYVERKPDPEDRRALRITLTASGTAICRRFMGASERALDAAQATLSTTERRNLIDYLQRILLTLRELD